MLATLLATASTRVSEGSDLTTDKAGTLSLFTVCFMFHFSEIKHTGIHHRFMRSQSEGHYDNFGRFSLIDYSLPSTSSNRYNKKYRNIFFC